MQCLHRLGMCHFLWRSGHCVLVFARFFPDEVGCVAGVEDGRAAADGGGGGEADSCGDVDRLRFIAVRVVCCRGS